jgi:hypothetical protein
MSHQQFLNLPDEVLVLIATQLPVVDFVHLQQTNKKLWEHLSQLSVFQKLMAASQVPEPYCTEMLQSLEELFLFQQIRATGLLDENRIGFEMGETEMFHDDGDHDRDETDIQGSQARISKCQQLLRQHPSLTVLMDSHCGTASPSHEMAGRFAMYRGDAIIQHFDEFMSDSPETTRLMMRAWGKRVLEAAARSNHKYAATAQAGKGWVEIRIGILDRDEFQVPCLPEYYAGIQSEDWNEEEEEEENGRPQVIVEDEDGFQVMEVVPVDTDDDSEGEHQHEHGDPDRDPDNENGEVEADQDQPSRQRRRLN